MHRLQILAATACTPTIALLLAAVLTASVSGQTTSQYIGPNNGVWNDPLNWSAGVPANGKEGLFNAFIPSLTVNFDMHDPTELNGFNIDAGGRLNLTDGRSLTILGMAGIGGIIDADGVDTMFIADSPTTFFVGNAARTFASSGAVISIAAPSFSWNQNVSNTIIHGVTGSGSLLDLSNATSFSVHGADGGIERFYDVNAQNGGVIDLSSVTAISGVSSGNNWLRFNITSGGMIDFDSLADTQGRIRFHIASPMMDFPSLMATASGTRFYLDTWTTVNTPVMEAMSGGVVSVPTFSLFNAPSLTSISGTTFDISDGGTVSAPNLTHFINSTVSLNPQRQFIVPPFTNINNSELHLAGGKQFPIAATGYSWNKNNSHTIVHSVTGSGSLLDMSSAISFSVHGADGGIERFYDINASNNGVIDLSSVIGITGVTSGNNWLRFNITSGGDIDLSSLVTTVGRTSFYVSVPEYSLPFLESAASTRFYVGGETDLDLPALESISGGRIDVETGGSAHALALASMSGSTIALANDSLLSAPNLTTFTNGFLSLNPTRVLIAPPFVSVNNSEFHMSGGIEFAIAAPSYAWNKNNSHTVVHSVTGSGSLLDLSSATSFSVHGADGGIERFYDIDATGGSTIDLSGAASVTGVTSGNNWLRFQIQSGSHLAFGSPTFNGRTQMHVQGGGSKVTFDGSATFPAAMRISAVQGATISTAGDFAFSHTNEGHVNLSDGRVHMKGEATNFQSAQKLEVAGADIGLPSGSISPNFQIGQLIVGEHDQPTFVRLIDHVDNGNRGPDGEPELLYLQGFTEDDGLRIRGGSTLILDGVQLYAVINNEWTDINGLFPPNQSQIQFDDGYIIKIKAGDLNGDGVVDVSDLLILLAAWGPCPRSGDCPADINGDGAVDVSDLLILLANWG